MAKDFQNNLVPHPITEPLRHLVANRKLFQKVLVLTVKWAVLIFSARYLYVNIIRGTKFSDIFALSLSILHKPDSIWLLSVCLVLVFVNWGLESLKWRYLLKRFVSISPIRSFAAVLSGNAVSLWMPNRVGEYIGRVFFLDPGIRIKSIFATLLGSMSQLVVTLFLGTLGCVFYTRTIDMPIYIQLAAGIAGLIFMALLLFFYFNIGIVRSWLPAKNWAKPLRKYLLVYKLYKSKDLETILLYSVSRYMVFSLQFYIFLVFFGIHIPFFEALLLIFLMYFVQTISPTSGFTELIVRGGTTAFLFKAYTTNLAAVLAASYSVWLINLLLPALAGAVIFGFARINKRSRAA
jgi:hypothetical protein